MSLADKARKILGIPTKGKGSGTSKLAAGKKPAGTNKEETRFIWNTKKDK